MIEKLNIKIDSKNTNKIIYILNLGRDYWRKREYDTEGKLIYSENSGGFWYKAEFNTEGEKIYHENSSHGIIRDDR
jgi:hypothetical protein